MTAPQATDDRQQQPPPGDPVAEALAALAAGVALAEVAAGLAAALGVPAAVAGAMLLAVTSEAYEQAANLLPTPEGAPIVLAVRQQQGAARRGYVHAALSRYETAVSEARAQQAEPEAQTLEQATRAWQRAESHYFAAHVRAQAQRAETARELARASERTGVDLFAWVTRRDGEACDSCVRLDGTRFVPSDVSTWPTGKAGYPVLPGTNHPQCRCDARPITSVTELSTPAPSLDFTQGRNATWALEALSLDDWPRFARFVANGNESILSELLAYGPDKRARFGLAWKRRLYADAGLSIPEDVQSDSQAVQLAHNDNRSDTGTGGADMPSDIYYVRGNEQQQQEQRQRPITAADHNEIQRRATAYSNAGFDVDESWSKARDDFRNNGASAVDKARKRAYDATGERDDALAQFTGEVNGQLTAADSQAMGVREPSLEEVQAQLEPKTQLRKLGEKEFVERNQERRQLGLEPHDSKDIEAWYVSETIASDSDLPDLSDRHATIPVIGDE